MTTPATKSDLSGSSPQHTAGGFPDESELSENLDSQSRIVPEPFSDRVRTGSGIGGCAGIIDPHVGDAYTFVGIERNTKLVLAWHLGQRDVPDTEAFTEKLDRATQGRFQLTTDGFAAYPQAVSYSLGVRVDYAQLIKVYGKDRDPQGEQWYSPPEVVDTIIKPMIGSPDPRRICTSIVERNNLSMRTSIRRLTRLTNAYSKKWENLEAMVALYFAYYNFCRIHSSIRWTPAMESGLTGHVWTLRELLAA
jgi:IS1 family transposase